MLIFTFLTQSLTLHAQATLPVSRTGWSGAEPTGWTNSGTTDRTSSFACSGSDAATFDGTGDRLQVYFNAAPDVLTFKLKKASMSGASSILVEESSNGSTWSTVGTYGTASGTTSISDCSNISVSLLATTRYVRWTYTKSSGNCDLDDVSITAATVSLPEINVKQGSTNLLDGSGSYSFGSVSQGASSSAITFTIENTGNANLTLSGSPKIAISGHTGDFTINQASTAATVSASGTTTFTITFNPTTTGSRSATISITNNDADENPYTFTVTGTGITPEINLREGSTNIASGGTYDFGSFATSTSSGAITFTIQNTGNATLSLSGSPRVAISGPDAADFIIVQTSTAATVAASGSTTFTIDFNPTTAGLKTATISIANNDLNENPYVINLTGTGLSSAPEINIKQGTTDIDNGSGTYGFGSLATGSSSSAITFTVENLGNADLLLSGTPKIGITGHTSDFTINETSTSGTVAASSATTFTITFNPNTAGARSATISIANNDADENPYTFTVTGTGLQSITTGSISGSPFCVGNGLTASVSVPYTVVGAYTAGNVFTAVLSNSSGSFASGTTNIGTVSATTAGSISATIPATVGAGAAYRISVVSSTPSVTGSDNGSNLTVQAFAGPSSVAAICANATSTVSWSNPSCFDEIMVVAKAGAFTSALPTGDGSTYTASLSYGTGTAFDGGRVVYKGSGTATGTITGLTNGTTYYFKTFARKGTIWVAGGTDNCSPVSGPCGTESFTNSTAPGSTYGSGSYTGDNGVTWTYYEARTPSGTYDITGGTIGFSDAGTGYVRANSGTGGVGDVTFSMRSYFTGGVAADRTIDVYVNGSLKGSYTLAAMSTIYTHTVTANEAGNVLIQFRSTGSRQVVIDDVSWTCFTGCTAPADPVGSINGSSTACASTSLTFTGSATSPVVYYWQTSASGTSTSSNAASSLTVNTSGSYYVRAYNPGTNCWSTGAVGPYNVTINNNASITSHPANQSVFDGDNVNFTVTASNAGGYQWQLNTGSGWGNISNGGVYSGATAATLRITGATSSMSGYQYRVVISGNSPCSGTTSNSATLTVLPAVAVTDDGCDNNDYATMTFNVSSNLVITDINVGVKVSTTWRGDLIIKVVSPEGTEITIMNSVGDDWYDLDALFDDSGTATGLTSGDHTVDGTYDETVQVQGALTDALSTFNGELSQGTWTLKVCDAEEFDYAYINGFEVFVTGTTPCTSTANITSFAPANGPAGTVVTITGSGFTGATGVKFNGVNATSYTVVNSSTITAKLPTSGTTGKISVLDVSGCAAKTSTSFTVTSESGTCGNGTVASELFISEIYDATTGDIHFVEIFNGTSATVNLSNYSVRVIAYGNNGSSTIDVPLNNFNLVSGATYILALGNSANPCGISTNQTNPSGGFNGNDEVMLRKSGVTIDFTENPNSGAGFSQIRKPSVTGPSTTYQPSQWTITSTESCSDLGNSPYAAGPSITITTNPSDVTSCTLGMSVAATSSTGITYQWKYNNGSSAGWTNVTTFSGTTVTGATSSTLSITGTTSGIDGYQFYCQVTAGSCVKNSDAAQYTFGVLPVFRSKANGNWSSTATWEMANTSAGPWSAACDYPTYMNTSEVIIKAGTNVYMNVDITIDKVTIESMATLEMATNAELIVLNSQSGADLIVNGTLIDRGSSVYGLGFEDKTGTANDASWIMGSTGTVVKTNTSSVANYRDFYQGGISTIPATANWYYRYNGDGSPNTTAVDMYYPNLYFENTANTGTFSWNTFSMILSGKNGYCTVKGDLNIGVTGIGKVAVVNNNFNAQPMLVLGDLYVESGNSLTTECDATLSPSNYDLNYKEGTGFEVRGAVYVEGTLDVNALSSGILRFSGTATQDVLGSGTLDLWDVDKTTSNTIVLDRPITVANNITLRSGTFNASGNNITIGGNWTNTGSTISHGNNTVLFNGSSNSFIISFGQHFHNLQVSKTGTGKVYPTATDLTVDNLLEVIQGAFEVPASRTVNALQFSQDVNGTTTIKATGVLNVNR